MGGDSDWVLQEVFNLIPWAVIVFVVWIMYVSRIKE
jgi:hypothetical protein